MTDSIVRLLPDGPAGLTELGFTDPRAVVGGNPRETAHVFLHRADGKVVVGVWEAQPGTLYYVDYPFDEVCWLLSGELELTPDGSAMQKFGAGDAFIIRKGFTGRWHMPSALRKYYVECRQ